MSQPSSPDLVSCVLCGKEVPASDACNDEVCRGCHKTESLEDCLAGRQVSAERARAGLPR